MNVGDSKKDSEAPGPADKKVSGGLSGDRGWGPNQGVGWQG